MFLEIFMSLYLLSLIIGKYLRLPHYVTDAIIVILIFTISFWGFSQVKVGVIYYLGISVLISIVVLLVTYFTGFLILKDEVHGEVKSKINFKSQLKYLIPLLAGFLASLIPLDYSQIPFDIIVDYELYLLAFVIGIDISKSLNKKSLKSVTRVAIVSVLVDFIGALLSSLLISLLIPFKVALMITLGSGWYSYTGPLVAKFYGPALGLVGFLSNFLREQLAFVFLPNFSKGKFSPIGAIAVGGATSMDVTLPLYVEIFNGGEYAISAMINGFILTLIIPIIEPLISLV
ncbi:MAG: lysine exporter LysO family protein [Sulfolobaceae archaeon]|nr:lysine exporter LysO family protein [Sulfolobaceae archaeon]